MADGEMTGRRIEDDGWRILMMDEGQWIIENGGPQLQQEHNNQTVHGRRRRKMVVVTNDNKNHI